MLEDNGKVEGSVNYHTHVYNMLSAKTNNSPKFIVVDFFCGAGGVSVGILNSDQAVIAAALNHSPIAIASHSANHPETTHFEDDIRKEGLELEVLKVVEAYRKLYPKAKVLFWCSAECTNFSQAKGGQSRDRDSRTLVTEMYRYYICNPDYILFENVKEFMSWGPLIPKRRKGKKVKDKNGDTVFIPDPKKKGQYYMKWIAYHLSRGYEFDCKLLNAADYGAATRRIRWFGIFATSGLPIVFPRPTHSKKGGGGLKKWIPCKKHINLDQQGMSVFGREFIKGKKPLSPKTMARIAYGIKKYCLPQYIVKYYGNGSNTSDVNDPLHTITTKDTHALLSLQFITQQYGRENANVGIENPLTTITTFSNQNALISTQFITQHFHNSNNAASIEEPLGAIVTKDLKQMITVDGMLHFISKHYTGNHASSIDEPLHTITTIDHNSLITVLAKVEAQADNSKKGKSIREERYRFFDEFFAEFPPQVIALLKLLITDISMRFLHPNELKKIQGFPADYHLAGNKTEQTKSIGNSVSPVIPEAWISALAAEMEKGKRVVQKRKKNHYGRQEVLFA